MLVTITYLAYRNHVVDTQEIVDNMSDIPQTNSEAIHNIFSSEDGNMFSITTHQRNVDSFVEKLAEKNINKLEHITDKTRVCVEVHSQDVAK